MNELIKIEQKNGVDTVNARVLWEFIESKRNFADWIKNRIKQYDFKENVDFICFHNFVKAENGKHGNKTYKDYYITIDMAKELSMVENNDKGREARKYFIECEQRLKTKQSLMGVSEIGNLVKSILEPILKQQNDFNFQLLQEVKSIKTESKQIEFKQDYYSILGYCNLKKIEMTFSDAIKHGKEAAKLSKEKGIEIHRIPDERWGTVNSYHISILNDIFKI